MTVIFDTITDPTALPKLSDRRLINVYKREVTNSLNALSIELDWGIRYTPSSLTKKATLTALNRLELDTVEIYKMTGADFWESADSILDIAIDNHEVYVTEEF